MEKVMKCKQVHLKCGKSSVYFMGVNMKSEDNIKFKNVTFAQISRFVALKK